VGKIKTMIEFMMRETNNDYGWSRTYIGNRHPKDLNFRNCDYKINDIVYTKFSEEFDKVALKEKMWEILCR